MYLCYTEQMLLQVTLAELVHNGLFLLLLLVWRDCGTCQTCVREQSSVVLLCGRCTRMLVALQCIEVSTLVNWIALHSMSYSLRLLGLQ